ncbi:MAG: glycosyltransferase [Taibaiella sp.]|jgi:GT2 family glycosyltransferase
MASLSILIITYNRPEDTLSLLQSINNQEDKTKHVKEILLLNNASTTSYQIIEDFIDQHPDLPVKYIKHSENLGVAKGRNYLIQLATAEYLMFLDDDVEFYDNNAVAIAATLFTGERYIEHNTAIITFNIFYYSTKERQISAFPHKDFKRYQNKEWFLTYYFTGAAHLMKKELFAKTGLYPSDFFYGMEEYDLSYRVIDAGYTIAFDHQIKVFHKESPEGRVTNSQKLGMMWLNKSKVAWRYLPQKYFYSTVFMWGLQFLKKTRFNLVGFSQILKKVTGFKKNVPATKISRKSMAYLDKVGARLWY